MALTVANLGPGNYVLGGPGRLQGPSAAEAIDIAQQREQEFRNAQRTAREAEQRMSINASEEQRRQQQFQLGLQDRAAARGRAAQQRAALDALMQGLTGVGAAAPAGGAPAIAPTAPPRAGLAFPTGSGVPLSYGSFGAAPAAPAAPAGGVPLSMGIPAPAAAPAGLSFAMGTPAPRMDGVQVASLDPTESFRLAFEARPDLFGGGVQVADASGGIPAGALPAGQPTRAEFAGVPFDVYPDGRVVNTLTNTEIPATGEYDALRTALLTQAGVTAPTSRAAVETPEFREVDPNAPAFTQDVQGLLRQGDIAGALSRIQVGLATGTYGPMGSPLGRAVGYFTDTPEDAARRTAVREATQWFNDPTNEQMLRANPDLIAEAAADPISFVARQQASAQTGTEPASPEAAAAEAPTTAEEAAPTQETTWGGLQLSFGTPVQLSFGEAEGEASRLYVDAPERIFQDAELATRQQQRLSLLATYYQQTGNLQGLVGVLNQLDELTIEQRYLDGMTAIVGIQQKNFGPVQTLLQQRYPGRQVEVRPYTDGTVEIFLDGQSEARLTWDDLAMGLRSSYDRGFIEQQQALATEAAERSRFLFEQETTQMLQGAREISVARDRVDVERLVSSGRIERIGETASGEVVFQTVVNGVPLQFVYRETMTRDPATGAEIPALVATPIDQTLVR
jgi:hypothetical protein